MAEPSAHIRLIPLATHILAALAAVPASAEEGTRDPSSRNMSAIAWANDTRHLADPAQRRGGLWERLAHIPLGEDPDRYMRIGGEVRYNYTYFDESALGVRGGRNEALQQRLRLHADVHMGPNIRIFAEIGDSREFFSKIATPPNRNRTELQQAFVDASFDIGAHRLTVRPGRFQMPLGDGVLVGLRDGVNVRFTYDGLRATWATPSGRRLDAFAVRPVRVEDDGAFDDSPETGAHFRGVYFSAPLVSLHGAKLDLFGYDSTRRAARYQAVTADETRYSLGARLWGRRGPIDYDVQAVRQLGDVGQASIQAWALMTSAGYTFEQARFTPRLSLKANAFSGDRSSTNSRIETFVAPFPRTPLYTDAGWFALMNQNSVHIDSAWKFTRKSTLTVGAAQLWRNSTHDGIYSGPSSAPLGLVSSGASRVGTLYNVIGDYQVNRFLDFHLYYTYVDADSALEAAGGRASNYVGFWGRLLF